MRQSFWQIARMKYLARYLRFKTKDSNLSALRGVLEGGGVSCGSFYGPVCTRCSVHRLELTCFSFPLCSPECTLKPESKVELRARGASDEKVRYANSCPMPGRG